MAFNNYLTYATVTTNNFADCNIAWHFGSIGMMLYNESTTLTVQVSFDGVNLHGDLNPALFAGAVYDGRCESQLWLRLAPSTSGSAVVRVECWGG